MFSIFRLKIVLAVGIFIFTATISNAFSQQAHPAEKTKAARSWAMDYKTSIGFDNQTGEAVKVYWLDGNAERHFLFDLEDDKRKDFDTYVSYMYVVTNKQGNALGMYASDAQPRLIRLTGGNADVRPPRERDPRDDNEDYADRPGKPYDTSPIDICSNQEIPRGFVITAAGNNWNCSNWTATGHNSYTIQRPSLTTTTTICSGQAVPRGFVIIAAGSSWNCSNWTATGSNSYTIRRPRDTEEICSASDIPRGFVVTAGGNSWNCPNWTATGSNSKTIKRIK